ncbi:hypothetical protein ABEB36_003691 [Hypothenemus hampei]|uniref:Peptidase S1 domain-containing protein n=1 Tax=Hypothenemus hampei TaxID=57062 RepID=A0ABD1F0T1_HYPHA
MGLKEILFLAIFTVAESLETTTINYKTENQINFANVTQCDCGWRNVQNSLQIVGGDETGVNEYPGMAALIYLSSGLLFCGAHIISDRYLLTAAHCIYNKSPSDFVALVGDHDISTGGDTAYSAIYYINAYEIYPTYDSSTDANDIAILRTSTQITFSTYVAPICLPFKYATYDFSSQPVTILGWGQIEFSGPTSNVLLKAEVQVLTNANCQSSYAQVVLSQEICTFANGIDSCQADSGGPVMWTNISIARLYLIGIISHGVGCATGYPGINVRVTSFLNWILSRTSDASYCYM